MSLPLDGGARFLPSPAAAAPPARGARYREFAGGWRVLAGAFLVNMVGFGAIYSYAAFADDLVATFGVSRATSSLVFALSGACCYAVSGLTGPLADRIGPRPLAIVGMAAVALGLMTASAARGMTEVLLCYGVLIGLGTGFAYVPAMAAVQRCFVAGRGLASGVAAAGVGVGTALVPPMAAMLTAFGDWRFAFAVSGLAAGAVGLGGAMLIGATARPRAGMPAEEMRAAALSGPAGASVFAGGGFARLYLGVLLVSIPIALPFAHLVGTARDLGAGAPDALGLLGVVGMGSIAGRFALGALADLAGRRLTFLACTTALVAATMLWALASSLAALTAFAFLFGAGYGGFVALLPAFATDQFGRRAAGTVIGLLYTGRAIALLGGPLAAGIAMEALHGHRLPVAAASLLGLVGVVLLVRVPRLRLAA